MTGEEGAGSGDPPGLGMTGSTTRGLAEDRNCDQVLMNDEYR